MKRDKINLARLYMSWIGPLGNLMFYIQAIKIYLSRKGGDISLLGFIISTIALISWLGYGVLIKDKPLIISNSIGTIGAILVLIGATFYS